MGKVELSYLLEYADMMGYPSEKYQIFLTDEYGNILEELSAMEEYTFTYPEDYWEREYCYFIRFSEYAETLSIHAYDSENDIMWLDCFFKSGMSIREILEQNMVGTAEIKSLIFKGESGALMELTLDSVLCESGTLEIEYQYQY